MKATSILKSPSMLALALLLALSIPHASAIEISTGTILKPNATSSGLYIVLLNADMDELQLNDTGISFNGLPAASTVLNIFYTNGTVKEYINLTSNASISYADEVLYLMFSSAASPSVTPGSASAGWFPIYKATLGESCNGYDCQTGLYCNTTTWKCMMPTTPSVTIKPKPMTEQATAWLLLLIMCLVVAAVLLANWADKRLERRYSKRILKAARKASHEVTYEEE